MKINFEINEQSAQKDFWNIIPTDFIKDIYDQFHLKKSEIHGVNHWSRVYYYGRELSLLHNIDLEIISYFSIIHDCKRLLEHDEADHGINAAIFFDSISDTLNIKEKNKEFIKTACDIHNNGAISDIPEIAVCLDADRLDLFRVGIHPFNAYLYFEESKNELNKLYIKKFVEGHYYETLLSKDILKKIKD